MKKLIFPLAISLLLLQCTKSTFNDLGGAETLKAVAVIYDTLNGVKNVLPANGLKIYIKNTGSAPGYLYSVTANAQGQFSFSGVDNNLSYTVYASSDTGLVKYYGQTVYANLGSSLPDTLRLYPAADKQNGIHLSVRDELGRPVAGTTAWVFNSAILFAADTSAGRILDMPTNSYGISNQFNLAAGTYYLRVKVRIGSLDLSGETSVNLDPLGIKDAVITLRTTPLARNGMEIRTLDVFTTPLGDAKVYCYRSLYVFQNDTINYSNSLFTLTSNQAGLAAAYIVDPGTYYLRAIKVVNTDTIKATTSFTINATAISQATMILN